MPKVIKKYCNPSHRALPKLPDFRLPPICGVSATVQGICDRVISGELSDIIFELDVSCELFLIARNLLKINILTINIGAKMQSTLIINGL